MKLYTFLLLMVTHTLIPAQHDLMDTEPRGKFRAAIDGISVPLMEDKLHPPMLLNKQGSLDGRVAPQSLISLSFVNTGTETSNDLLVEQLHFEVMYAPGMVDSPARFNVSLQYNGNSYFPVLDNSSFVITKLIWNMDKKSFEIAADFNCLMRSYGHLVDGTKDVLLSGSMAGIRVTVPAWVASR